jgi:hypothetical protein
VKVRALISSTVSNGLTTLALMAHLNGQFTDFSMHYNSPISQRQIVHNLAWLKQHSGEWLELIDFNLLQFSLVITRSEDQAYQFFETQNTGGVRLNGDQIIKAHHLRAIGEKISYPLIALPGVGKHSVICLILLIYWLEGATGSICILENIRCITRRR